MIREEYMNSELIFANTDFEVPMLSFQRYPYPKYHT